ncbi:MAG: squalene/phytoene synthase family protein [Planctomycetota bacterium]
MGPSAAHPSVNEVEDLPRQDVRTPRENFPVLSWALDHSLRPGFVAVYTFCRISDDLADDPTHSRDQRRDELKRWREELELCFAGRPRLPAMTRLRSVAEQYHLPATPFHRLLDAFEEDQVRIRYQTWSELQSYADRSANPVGELVLRLAGHSPAEPGWPELMRLSDATCTALQFVNFWQDVRRDLLELDRIYLPLAETGLTEAGLIELARGEATNETRRMYGEALKPLVDRTDSLMRGASLLPRLTDTRIAKPVMLFQSAGLLLGRRIAAIDYGTLWTRPRISRLSLALASLRTLLTSVPKPT